MYTDDINLYLLAGLGLDYRLFDNLTLNSSNINHLNYLEPEKNESLNNYVHRMARQINRSKPIILIGHSFGGIIVQEISKIIEVNQVIIISSIKSIDEMPNTLKFLKYFPLYKYFNKKLVLISFPFWAKAFGYNSEKGRNLFIKMISSCTDNYFRWSIDKIVNWKGIENADNVIHIHGSNDKTFFLKNIKNPIIIPDGSHFMVFSKGEEVSEELNKILRLKIYSQDIQFN